MNCPRCGTNNPEGSEHCFNCGASVDGHSREPAAANTVRGQAGAFPKLNNEPSASIVPSRRLSSRFLLFAAALTVSVLATALLVKRVRFEYDASGQCVLDRQYTDITHTSGSSTTHSYRVTYKFTSRGESYSGTDTIYHEPTNAISTVYFRAANPRDNGLWPSGWNENALIAAGISLVIALVASWRLPKDYFTAVATASRERVGDSGDEHLTIERGKYGAWSYVEIAFFGQGALVGTLIAWMLSSALGLQATSDGVLTVAIIAAACSTLWVYLDRWRCIEAYSSQFCSGVANLSLFYVPVVAFFYANYRAMMRLKGR